MAANLMELAKGYLSSEVMHRIGSALGENPDRVEKAIDAGIPTLLAGFMNKASSSGADRLFEMVKHEPSDLAHMGGLDGVLGNLGSLMSGGSLDTLIKYGQNVLNFLFGDKFNSIVDLITRSSGLKSGSATSLLGMLTPLLMGVLHKETVSRGLSPSSLTNLLVSQKDAITRMAPAGLSNALGLRSLSDLGAVTGPYKVAGAAAPREYGRPAPATGSDWGGWMRWALPLALLGAALLALYYWPRGRARQPQEQAERPVVTEVPKPIPAVVPERRERTTEVIKDAGRRLTPEGKVVVETTSRRVTLALPGNIKLEVPENSYLQAMVKFFTNGPDGAGPKRYVADNLNFEGTTAKLSADSSAAVNNLATIMKAYDTVKLKIEGYTDNVGDAAVNRKISLERATTVKDALVKAGVPADRITVEGVGPDRPIASNDTEEGRAKNRRIELEIVSK